MTIVLLEVGTDIYAPAYGALEKGLRKRLLVSKVVVVLMGIMSSDVV